MKHLARARHGAVRSIIVGAMLAAMLASTAWGASVTKARLENAVNEPENWLLGFQNYASHRYSKLAEINRDNVADLKVAFTVPMSDALLGRDYADFYQHGLVDDGFMYIDTGTGIIYKIDLRAGGKGIMVWKADAAVSPDEPARTRGMAMWDNAVYHNLMDGRVVAVDRNTGEFLWDKQIARVADPGHAGVLLDKEGFVASPLAVEGRILVGQSSGENGARGWLAALDANTGEQLWRTYTIPAPGEPGHETWADNHGAWMTGGASLWTTGAYDPVQRLTIWGAASPAPTFDPAYRPGDNLYTNSAIAFDVDTGEIRWYHQYVPSRSWSYDKWYYHDENGSHMLFDVPYMGQDRQMVGHFGRGGFFYQLDRADGAYLGASQYVDQVTWTVGLDPKTGMPTEYEPGGGPEPRLPRFEAEALTACPIYPGAVRWQPPAYDPVKRIAYAGSEDGCQSGQTTGANTLGLPAKKAPEQTIGLLTAIDVTTGEVVARHTYPHPNKSGVLATSGGLIFTGWEDGALTAHDGETLDELWRFETGIGIKAPWITFTIDGKQHLAIAAGAQTVRDRPALGLRTWGAMLYVFAL